MKIGIISDTHGYFDPQIRQLFAGVDHILHGGDIGQPQVIAELAQIAPVTAVLGNNDLGLNYALTEVVRLASWKFLIHHIVDALAPDEVFQLQLNRENPDVVVFGHTHKRLHQWIGPTLYLNPGYAGKPRFNLPRSVAILHGAGTVLTVKFRTL